MRRFIVLLAAAIAVLAGALTAQAATSHPAPQQAPRPATASRAVHAASTQLTMSMAAAKRGAAQAFKVHTAHLAHTAHAAHTAHLARLASIAHAAHLAQLAAHQAHLARLAAHQSHLAHVLAAARHPVTPAPSTATVHESSTAASAPASSAPATYSGSGTYSYAQLEQLWLSAGGSASAAAQAATIAECESGGRASAYNPSGATGLWQILGAVSPGDLTNPSVNAANAVSKFNASGGTFAQWVCQ